MEALNICHFGSAKEINLPMGTQRGLQGWHLPGRNLPLLPDVHSTVHREEKALENLKDHNSKLKGILQKYRGFGAQILAKDWLQPVPRGSSQLQHTHGAKCSVLWSFHISD